MMWDWGREEKRKETDWSTTATSSLEKLGAIISINSSMNLSVSSFSPPANNNTDSAFTAYLLELIFIFYLFIYFYINYY